MSSLYKVTTKGCGSFHVVAKSFDEAVQEVRKELNDQDYGYYHDRLVVSVEFICIEEFMSNGKRILYGENDVNHLMVVKD